MAYNNGIDGKALLDEISKVIDAAANQYNKAGEEAGEEFVEGFIDGIKKYTKEAKSEISQLFEDFNRMTNNFKTRKSVSNAEWQNVLRMSKELLKSERYADTVRDKLSDIAATFKNIGKVSGLDKILAEIDKAENRLQSVSWVEEGKNYKKKKSATSKPKAEKPVVTADPTPVIEAEKKKQQAIRKTAGEYRASAEAAEESVEEAAKLTQAIFSRISKNSSISGLENLEEEAVNVTRALAEMYDAGITDTEKYITLQYKLSKLLDKMAGRYGTVKSSGAKDKTELMSWVYDRIEQVTGTDILGISSVMENLLGDSDFSIFNNSFSGLGMKHVADLLRLKGTYGDWVDVQEKLEVETKDATDAVEAQGDAIDKTAKKMLNMESVVKRYNKLMDDIGVEHLTIGTRFSQDTDGWGLKEMVQEAKYQLENYYNPEHDSYIYADGLTADVRKRMQSEIGRLKRFIAAYEPYVDVVESTVPASQSAAKAAEQQTDALREQEKAAEDAAKAQEKLNKSQSQHDLSEEEINHALDVKSRYTGAGLKGKSDFVDAIKYEWERGNKAVSSKLFEQYKARFADGKYDPSTDAKFGSDWSENYNKYLEQANRHLAEMDKRLGNAANGVIEIQGEFKKLGDIVKQEQDIILADVNLDPTKFYSSDRYDFTDSDISAAETQLESARQKAQELKDEAFAAKEAFDQISNIRSQYTGKFKGKSDLQAAIKDEWSKGNKSVAAKLFEQYKTRFPEGAFDPSKQKMFGDDWINNYETYLEQANRHIVELDTMLNGMATKYGKYRAYQILESFVQDKEKMLNEVKQNKLVGEVVRNDLESRREASKNKYATDDAVVAQENLNKALSEYNRRQQVANELLEKRDKMISALDDDEESLSGNELFVGYNTPADAISAISKAYQDASLDAERFGITDLKEAVSVARELGVEVDKSFDAIEQGETGVVNALLMRQKNFAMHNEDNANQIFDYDEDLARRQEILRVEKKITDEKKEQADASKEVADAQRQMASSDDGVADELKYTFDIIKQGESVTGKFVTTASTLQDALQQMRQALPEDQKEWESYIEAVSRREDDRLVGSFKSVSGSMGKSSERYKLESLDDGRIAITFSGIRGEIEKTADAADRANQMLVGGENKYQQELDETAKIQQVRQAQADAYTEAAMNLFSAGYESIPEVDKYKMLAEFGNKILTEGMSASDAMDQLYLALENVRKQAESMPDDIIGDFGADSEKLRETVSQLQKLSSIEVTRIFDSVDLRGFLESFNIDESDFAIFRSLFEELMQIAKAMANGVDVGNAFDLKMEEITNTIMKLGGHMMDLGDDGYGDMIKQFYSHMSKTKVQFNDTIKADYTKDQWKSLYRTYQGRLTADQTKGIPADSLYHELSGLFPSLFPEGVLAQQDQFKLIFEMLDEARRLQANNWKTLHSFASGERNGVQDSVDDIYNEMNNALFAGSSADAMSSEAGAAQDVANNMNNAANAKDKFANANKRVGDSAKSSADGLGDEADAMEKVATSAEDLPDGDVVTKLFIGENDDPSGAIIKQMRIVGDKMQTEAQKLAANEDGGWDVSGSTITEKKLRGMTEYIKAYRQEANKLNGIQANIRALGDDGMSNELTSKVKSYTVALEKMNVAIKKLQANPNDPVASMEFDDAAREANRARTEIDGIFKASQKISKIGKLKVVGQEDVSKVENLKTAMVEFANSTWNGEAKITGFNKEGTQMYVTLNQGAGAVENITVALDKASGRLNAFSTGTSQATNEWEKFKKQAASGIARTAGMYLGFNDLIRYGRQGLEYVKDIDLAMTELKKVTDETDAAYKEFLGDAGKTAAVIGSTISDFTEASATFARLGYSLEESAKMAETSIIYKNVADGLDSVEESSQSIISTMMAFGIEANDTMSIIDRFNAVGNNFAITSAGIGEALQRSASALFSAGNTLDESVALVTAANSVVDYVPRCYSNIVTSR